MKRTKGYLALLLVLLMLTGCSSKPASTPAASSTPAQSAAPAASAATGMDLSDLDPINLVFGTMSVGSAYYTETNAINTVALPALPSGSYLDIQTISSGSVASFLLVATGQADLAVTDSVNAKLGVTEGLEGTPPAENVYAIAGGFDDAVSFIVFTQDFVNKTGLSTLEEVIEAKYPVNLATKGIGSMGEATASRVLAAYGLTYEDIESWGGSVSHTDSSNLVDMLKDNRADLAIDHTTTTQSSWMELTMTKDVHFAPMSEECLVYMSNCGYVPTTMPTGTYNGEVEEDYACVGAPGMLVASGDIPNEYAYLLAKAICENKDGLVGAYDAFRVFVPENAGKQSTVSIELHPGAKLYYEEKGWSVD